MSDDTKNIQPDDDRYLDRLIRAAGKSSTGEFIRPVADVIAAYLLGKANRSQKNQVRTAMLQSPEFRLELRALTADLEFIGSLEAKKNFAEAGIDHISEFESLSEHKQDVVASKVVAKSWPSRVISILTTPRFAGVAAAICLIAISSIIYINRGPSFEFHNLNLENRAVDVGLLVPTGIRGESGQAEITVYSTAMGAALSVFRSSIEFEEGIPTVLKVEKGDLKTDDSFALRLTVPDGSSADYVVATLAFDPTTSVKNVQFWVLTVPSLSLYSLTLSENGKLAEAKVPRDNDFIVVCSWQTSSGYSAARALAK